MTALKDVNLYTIEKPIYTAETIIEKYQGFFLAGHSNFVRLFLLINLLLSVGCASLPFSGYGPDRQSLEDFEKRVEAAFRLQNKMTSEMMLLQDADIPKENQEVILAAEEEMRSKCGDLNEYASRDIDGLSKSFLLQRRVENSVAACESAARLLDTLINTSQR